MNFVSDLQWYQILSPPQCMFISDISDFNEHMGLLILVSVIGIDSFREQYLFNLYNLSRCYYYSGKPLSPPQQNVLSTT